MTNHLKHPPDTGLVAEWLCGCCVAKHPLSNMNCCVSLLPSSQLASPSASSPSHHVLIHWWVDQLVRFIRHSITFKRNVIMK
eukprot:scaffold30993_cov50-Cyclotella_meneghiniana.AAC.2